MKTPIQEVIDLINKINDNDLSEFNYYYEFIMDKLNELLEKEKEHTVDFADEWFTEYLEGLGDYKTPRQYYNQTYNQAE